MKRRELSSKERVLTALRREEPDRIPWIESFVHPALAKEILNFDPVMPPNARISPQIVEILNLDNLTYNLKPPEFAEKHLRDGIEFVGHGLIKTREDLNRVVLPDPDDRALYEPLEEFIKEHRKDYALMVGMRFGLANTYLSMGIENFCLSLYDDPEFVFLLMDKFLDWTFRVLDHIQEMDVDLLFFSEDIGDKNGPIFSPKMVKELFVPRMKRVADKIHLPWIYHSDGNYLPVLDDLLTLGMSGIANLEPGAMDLAQLKRDYGDRVALVGNIDLHYTLPKGSVEETEAEVRQRIREAGEKGGYLLASSNGLVHYCRKENVLAMSRVVGESYYPLDL